MSQSTKLIVGAPFAVDLGVLVTQRQVGEGEVLCLEKDDSSTPASKRGLGAILARLIPKSPPFPWWMGYLLALGAALPWFYQGQTSGTAPLPPPVVVSAPAEPEQAIPTPLSVEQVDQPYPLESDAETTPLPNEYPAGSPKLAFATKADGTDRTGPLPGPVTSEAVAANGKSIATGKREQETAAQPKNKATLRSDVSGAIGNSKGVASQNKPSTGEEKPARKDTKLPADRPATSPKQNQVETPTASQKSALPGVVAGVLINEGDPVVDKGEAVRSTAPSGVDPKAMAAPRLVAFTPDGKSAIFSDPISKLPVQYKLGQKLPSGETLLSVSVANGKAITSSKEYNLD